MKSYALIITQIILLVFSPVAFGAKQAKSGAKKPVGDKVVVTVNGVGIMQSELSKEISIQLKKMRTPANALTKEMRFELRRMALNSLIERQVISDWVSAEKIIVKDDDIYERLQMMARREGTNMEGFLKMVKVKEGIDPEELKKRIRIELGFDRLIEKEAGEKAFKVNEGEAKRHYEKHINEFKTPTVVRASHILVKFDGSQEAAAARVKVKDIMKQVKSGVDFSMLAAQYSADETTRKLGGDLGYFTRDNMLVEIADVAFVLIPGEVSEPVKMPYGYHIIKVTDRKGGEAVSFEEARAGIIQKLSQEKRRGFSAQYVAQLLARARIVWPRQAGGNTGWQFSTPQKGRK